MLGKTVREQVSARVFWWKARRAHDVWKLTDSSSVFQWLLYDGKRHVLTAQFRTGRRYCYDGLPPTVAKELFTSDSAGRFFNRAIRPTFVPTRLA